MKKILLFVSIAALLASCSSKPKVELEVNIQNNSSLMKKKFVVCQRIDGRVVYTDTTKIKKDHFLLDIPYKGPGLINVSIPESNLKEIMMASEEGKIQLDIDGVTSRMGGTPLNDRLQAFYLGNDSVSLLFKQLDQEYESLQADTTHHAKGEYQKKSDDLRQRRTQLLISNTDRLVAFIKENVDNPVGEYYFMINYITFPLERKLELNSFATDKLKREFGMR